MERALDEREMHAQTDLRCTSSICRTSVSLSNTNQTPFMLPHVGLLLLLENSILFSPPLVKQLINLLPTTASEHISGTVATESIGTVQMLLEHLQMIRSALGRLYTAF